MTCRHCDAKRPQDSFPPELFVLTSSGTNALPDEEGDLVLFLDENVHERIDRPNAPEHFIELRNWLIQRDGRRILGVSSSVALEHVHSTHRKPLVKAEQVIRDLNKCVLREPSPALIVADPDRLGLNPIAQHAASTLVSMAEIAWVRRAFSRGRLASEAASENINSFVAWRHVALPRVPTTAGTVLCLASLMGNALAIDCLKIRKTDTADGRLLRNGAFDAEHLEHYLHTATVARMAYPSCQAAFVTGDRALATFLQDHAFFPDGHRQVLGVDFRKPWLKGKAQRAEAKALHWGISKNSTTHRALDLARLAVNAIHPLVGDRTLAEVERLYRRLVDYLQ